MLLDLAKCHDPGPDYLQSLAYYEEATIGLEKRMSNISSILLEKKKLAEKDAELSYRLIEEFEFFSRNELNPKKELDANLQATMEQMTQCLRQLAEHRERYIDQIEIGIVKPLNQFLSTEFGQVNVTKKAFHKSHTRVTQLVEKLCQAKKQDIGVLNELSSQLFDTRADFHKISCQYALELIHLHKKKRPEFIEILLNLMMYDCSYFHLGHVTLKEVELQVNEIYKTCEQIRSKVISSDSERKLRATGLLEQMLLARGKDLVLFHQQDLQLPLNVAVKNVGGHLRRMHQHMTFEEKDLKPSSAAQPTITRGYLFYAEPRTFGTSWIRLYFYIRSGQLFSQESTKLKTSISLNLSLCNVKEVPSSEAERSFCFKVTSPVRILLLQAESSREMSLWIEALGTAITSSFSKEATPLSSSAPREQNTVKLSSINALKELHAIEGNGVCADCGAESPKWTSVNHGILVCIECSGAHRSMGVQISQVRSLTLDMLKPEWIEKLKQVGNRQSNAVYEALLPADFNREELKKFEKRNEFIVEKYKDLKYTRPEDAELILEERQRRRTRHKNTDTSTNGKETEPSSQPPSTTSTTSTTTTTTTTTSSDSNQAAGKPQEPETSKSET